MGRPIPPPLQPVSHQEPHPSSSGLYGSGSQVKVRAWVNGKPIFDEDIYAIIYPALQHLHAQSMPESERARKQADLFKTILEQFIDRELLYQDAIRKIEAANPKAMKKLKEVAKKEFEKEVQKKRRDAKITEETFQEVLRRQGMTMAAWERMEERKFIANEYLISRIHGYLKPSREDLWEYYETHLNEFQRLDSVDWQDLFIAADTPKHPSREAARRRAEELAYRLKKGEPFANLLQYDDGLAHLRQGEGFGKRRGEIQPPEVEKYLFAMRDGEVSPPIEISTGFHIVRLVKREQAGQIPFNEETQRLIANKLRNEIFEREAKRILHDLRSRAIIEIEKN
jgi:peptidyl-prolyl cis-trans isomerase SurA